MYILLFYLPHNPDVLSMSTLITNFNMPLKFVHEVNIISNFFTSNKLVHAQSIYPGVVSL